MAAAGGEDFSASSLTLSHQDMEVISVLRHGPPEIKLVRNPATGDTFALKSIPINVGLSEKGKQEIYTRIVQCFDSAHPNIATYFGTSFDACSCHIGIEYMNAGSLADLYRVAESVTERALGKIAVQALTGLHFLHHQRDPVILHRSLSPSNILLNTDGQVKITDFGMSKILGSTDDLAFTFVAPFVVASKRDGVRTYLSPERIQNAGYGRPADVWSLGVSLMEAGCGAYPFRMDTMDSQTVALLDRIVEDDVPVPPQRFSEEFRVFLNKCVEKDPIKRATVEELLEEDEWIRKTREDDFDLAFYIKIVKQLKPSRWEGYL
mmetsp:Transcript_9438/g.25599  ORF Transcript_9438/g.25599 Transcript_9438/m.25599 type:complete len:321 (-) Transcript_9438:1960-2922(-)|eukprot:CAMPEP_0113892524 /NCGR_PEP_ID=MMETSP0780_2-20120614/15475_1 /TAXON_ID=652834 /ORGANISM="Palpitomonas bilix" /LENGTH=320 /DNA_ID=CAMNT_0000882493 /DNA_START=440 /DNA_END=1402 /DNA_ORIENTATION=- /assembly_acc=CAM_ASM_000599